ncbi:MAG TPA: hypothetical protein RMH85_19400 [Polyangiaceae bacterium LLY-WYZ-15_(1-7)]|nr:hypothetical protein [Sandaracinus sp.]HJK94970.1 hypothetical protein [Polyangiaceae bacterium LLY-WYZ-15_(1-7)]MBJ73582.1 hypothetical protein [Sandaracinus sp.]HJL03304.1 hypothetical protein [Polyangiaceae bacterium LLY-WYZ-15_(1-7)]HJL10677.1 hypothetical protein [Polyangiaceae bacterium LLY-WYZ-15_(1-7)]
MAIAKGPNVTMRPSLHIASLRVLNLFFAILALGVAAAFFGVWTWPALSDAMADGFLAAMGGLIAVVMSGVGLSHLLVMLCLGKGRGRGLQTLLAFALIMTFPLGTFYALYALWVCWANPATRRHLSGDEPDAAEERRPFARAAMAAA